jgi:hypothetical protein
VTRRASPRTSPYAVLALSLLAHVALVGCGETARGPVGTYVLDVEASLKEAAKAFEERFADATDGERVAPMPDLSSLRQRMRGAGPRFEFRADGTVQVSAPGTDRVRMGRWTLSGKTLTIHSDDADYVGTYEGDRIVATQGSMRVVFRRE